jgi:hypothetical protein
MDQEHCAVEPATPSLMLETANDSRIINWQFQVGRQRMMRVAQL